MWKQYFPPQCLYQPVRLHHNWKDHNFRVTQGSMPGFASRNQDKTVKYLGQHIRYCGRDLNWECPEYKSEVLLVEPSCQVQQCWIHHRWAFKCYFSHSQPKHSYTPEDGGRGSSKITVPFHQATMCHIPEEDNLYMKTSTLTSSSHGRDKSREMSHPPYVNNHTWHY